MLDFHSAIFNTTQALILVLDAEGRVVMFNPACERLTGYRLEEVQGRPFWDFMAPPEERDGIMAAFRKPLEERLPGTCANFWTTRSGERRFIEWSSSAVRDDRGRIRYVVGTGIDMTARRSAETALRESEERQRALLDSIPDGAWLKNARGEFIEINRIGAERVGCDRAGIIGRSVEDLAPAEVAAQWSRFEARVMSAREPLREEKSRTIDGRLRWFDVIVSPVIGPAGEVIGTAGVSRDITERKLADAGRLLRDAALRATLIREVHHRIKNNLQGVIPLVQELARAHPGDSALLDAVIARLNTVATVHGLFAATGERELALEQIVAKLVASLKLLNDGLQLRLSISGGGVAARLAESEVVPLSLILNELIMNAIKHSRGAAAGRPVEVALDGEAERCRVVVRNAGGQLPAQFCFENDVGLGTGLRLVRSLLPCEGAALRFENAGAGVEVGITLAPPVIATAAAA